MILVAIGMLLAFICHSGFKLTVSNAMPLANSSLVYPSSPKSNQVDDYHGIPIADPYRWLEDPDAAETKAWVAAQNQLTFGLLEQLPERTRIQQRLTQLWNYEKFGIPFKEGDRYFFFKNNGLQNQNV